MLNKGLKVEKIPKTVADCVFDEFAFCLEEKQFQVLLKILASVNNYAQEIKVFRVILKFWYYNVFFEVSRMEACCSASRRSCGMVEICRYFTTMNSFGLTYLVKGTVILKEIHAKKKHRSWAYTLAILKKRKEYISLFKRTQSIADWVRQERGWVVFC